MLNDPPKPLRRGPGRNKKPLLMPEKVFAQRSQNNAPPRQRVRKTDQSKPASHPAVAVTLAPGCLRNRRPGHCRWLGSCTYGRMDGDMDKDSRPGQPGSQQSLAYVRRADNCRNLLCCAEMAAQFCILGKNLKAVVDQIGCPRFVSLEVSLIGCLECVTAQDQDQGGA